MGSCEGDCVGVMDVVCVVDEVTVVTLVGDILFGSVMNTTKYNSLTLIIKICYTN